MDSLLKKMKFSPDHAIAVIGVPINHLLHARLEAIGIPYSEDLNGSYSWMAIAVTQAAEVGIAVPEALHALAKDGLLWILYPKKSGNIPTDLSRDHGWEALKSLAIRHLNLISVDDDWTAWCVAHGSDAVSEKNLQKSASRNALLAEYMDHNTREMRYPLELEALLQANPREQHFFAQLSFTNRKEYVEWIVSAKRPETKLQRLEKVIPYLQEQRKNPAGR
jgi:Bacteriocin-protection, YdeI or OmpD-Associated